MLGKFTEKMIQYAIMEEVENAIEQHGLFYSFNDFMNALEGEMEEVKESIRNYNLSCYTSDVSIIEKRARDLIGELVQVCAVIEKNR